MASIFSLAFSSSASSSAPRASLVAYLYTVLVNIARESKRLIEIGKEADRVDILGCGQLHARYHEQTDLLADLDRRLTVERGVVVGEGYHVKSEQLSHIDEVIRRHFHIAAGREA